MRARKAEAAEAAYEGRKLAFFNDFQADGASDGSPSSSLPIGENDGHHQASGEHRGCPSRPRILGLENETNLVGVNQQEQHTVQGGKYGFYTVVNDAYFDNGPTVRPLVVCLFYMHTSMYIAGRSENVGK